MSCNQGLRAYKDGDVMLGGLISLHMSGEFSAKEFGLADAVIFAIDMVNKNSSLLANVSLGYDIRNYCDSRVLGMQEAFDFKRNSGPVFMCKSNSSMSTESSSVRGWVHAHLSAYRYLWFRRYHPDSKPTSGRWFLLIRG